MSIVKHVLSFGAGELSPWLDGRTDIDKYSSGCRGLENFIVLPQGAIQKRPGMEHLGSAPEGATLGRLVEFQVSTTEAEMLVLGGGKLAVWSTGEAAAAVLELDIPWADAELTLLRWKQINSVMFLVHPGHAPRKLTRYAADDWELTALDLGQRPALLPENFREEHTIEVTEAVISVAAWTAATIYNAGQKVTYPTTATVWKCMKRHTSNASKPPGSAAATYTQVETINGVPQNVTRPLWVDAFAEISAVPGQEVTLVASLDTWQAGHVGSVWEIARQRLSGNFEVELKLVGSTSPQYSLPIIIQGGWTFVSFGNWRGTWTVQKSEDFGATWEDVRAWEGDNDRNVSGEGTEEKRVQMRVKWVKDPAVGTGPGWSNETRAALTSSEAKIRGLVVITGFTNSKTVAAEVLTPVEIVKTWSWSESAWNEVQGWPRTVELHQGRVVMAATGLRPHTLWGSAVDDYEDFYKGTDADQAWMHTIAVGEKDPILWLVSERFLLVGTGSGEFVLHGEDEERAITPEFGTAKRHSSYGAHNGGVPACFSDSVALFVQRGGTRVREFSYRYEADRYEAANLNILADHLFTGPVEDIGVMRMPWQVVWFVSAGKLYGLSYERAQGVAAWHRHTTDGTVLGVGTIRAVTDEDEVWFLTDRGAGVAVERFRRGHLAALPDDGWWSDGAVGIPAPYSSFEAARHLSGKLVMGYAAGRLYGAEVIAGEEITLGGEILTLGGAALTLGEGDLALVSGWPFVTLLEMQLAAAPAEEGDPVVAEQGTFLPQGERFGKVWWQERDNDGTFVQWVPGRGWVLYIAGAAVLESAADVQRPDLVPAWETVTGAWLIGEYDEDEEEWDGLLFAVQRIGPDMAGPVTTLAAGLVPDWSGVEVPFQSLGGSGRPIFFLEAEAINIFWGGGTWFLSVGAGGWYAVSDAMTPMEVTEWTPLPGNEGNPVVEVASGGRSLDLVLGLPYVAAAVPMTAEIPLANGSSRSRETRVHRVALSLRSSRGGHLGETVEGKLDPVEAGSLESGVFTGEIEKDFDGAHGTAVDVAVVSGEPYPFAVRSLALKMNVFGDG